MNKLLREFEHYLRETLQITVAPKEWEDVGNLPFFLRDLYTFFQLTLLDVPCLLMVARDTEGQTPATVRKQMAQVQSKWTGEVIYLCPTLSAYNRKRLIEQRVPFVSPGNQMYLPMLGIDLREHFRQTRISTPGKISPATQAVLIHALLQEKVQGFTPSRLAYALGYTAMTLTRAFTELESLGLGAVFSVGRERVLSFGDNKKDLWERAQVFMRSPVKKRVFIHPPADPWGGLPAGLSALAHKTMLAPPITSVYALGMNDWQAMQLYPGIEVLPHPEAGAVEVEIWHYSPLLFQHEGVVDPFSLYLSLRDNTDERVQSALEKMMAEVLW